MDDPRIGQALGRYRLLNLIGSGGMGTVYLAEASQPVNRRAAVKILHSSHPDDRTEAVILLGLRHSNIVRYFDDDLDPRGRRYLVMEYVDGMPITDYADQQRLSIHARLALFLQACQAIDYSHRQFTFHLDLKPANILVTAGGDLKIIDFGNARRLDERRTSVLSRAFSLPYASPEQLQGIAPLREPSDTYSLGAVLYELLCGHEPFDSRLAPGELARQVTEEAPRKPSNAVAQSRLKQSPSGKLIILEPEKSAELRGGCRLSEARRLLSGGLDRVCLYALRKEPERRYASADQLELDIRRVLDGRRPALARSNSPVYTVLRCVRQAPIAFYGVVLAVALITYRGVPQGFSGAARAGLDNRSLADRAASGALTELETKLRPLLQHDPSLRPGLETLDAIRKTATPPPQKQTLWARIHHYFESSLRYNQRR